MKNKNKQIVIAIVGPTASGKTSLSIDIAKELNTEIISADSRQIYKEFNIATAKPTELEKQGVVHHLMDFVEPVAEYTVADFKDDATAVIGKIHSQNKIPVIVGGTGLYFRMLLENYEMPRVAPNKELRDSLHFIEQKQGVQTLYKMLVDLDPVAAERIHPNNTVKIVRALEVCKTLGVPMSEAQKIKTDSEYNVIWFGLGHLNGDNRKILYDRVDKRVDIMVEQGIENEARYLFEKYGRIQSLEKTIGYQEFIEYFENKISRNQVIDQIKLNTRRYAKRQLTWFRRNKSIHWLDINQTKAGLLSECQSIIQKTCDY